jgi:hypothetical protein
MILIIVNHVLHLSSRLLLSRPEKRQFRLKPRVASPPGTRRQASDNIVVYTDQERSLLWWTFDLLALSDC